MKQKEFHYIMTHDEFGEGGLMNNYYLLWFLMFGFIVFMFIGAIGWLIYLLN